MPKLAWSLLKIMDRVDLDLMFVAGVMAIERHLLRRQVPVSELSYARYSVGFKSEMF